MSLTARFPSSDSRVALAKRLGLPYSSEMQDWEWEVADRDRFDEFIACYDAAELTEGERFSLMEILVQCVEDLHHTPGFALARQQLEQRLSARMTLHRPTVQYWALQDNARSAEQFYVTPLMRQLLVQVGAASGSRNDA
ncbi:hypothetical protein [Aquabacterium humicola]|uniref:hypothetical protein n=1 Tax=Aquabacterium humicola TaxID=3237377 RepID=UPI0025439183|nr:hypothetical protein [Rubrivivax pictus]